MESVHVLVLTRVFICLFIRSCARSDSEKVCATVEHQCPQKIAGSFCKASSEYSAGYKCLCPEGNERQELAVGTSRDPVYSFSNNFYNACIPACERDFCHYRGYCSRTIVPFGRLSSRLSPQASSRARSSLTRIFNYTCTYGPIAP